MKQAEFRRLVDENASAPPGERLTDADLLVDPGYEERLERQGKELCEEVGRWDPPDKHSPRLPHTGNAAGQDGTSSDRRISY